VLDAPSEVRSTDIARAEVLLDAGLIEQAGQVLESVADAANPRDATVGRLTGRRHLEEGRLAEARTVLEAALAAADANAERYEEGMLLMALAELARREQTPDGALRSRVLIGRAVEILQPLGVRADDTEPLLHD
jgi:uncharacterized protein HemY